MANCKRTLDGRDYSVKGIARAKAASNRRYKKIKKAVYTAIEILMAVNEHEKNKPARERARREAAHAAKIRPADMFSPFEIMTFLKHSPNTKLFRSNGCGQRVESSKEKFFWYCYNFATEEELIRAKFEGDGKVCIFD